MESDEVQDTEVLTLIMYKGKGLDYVINHDLSTSITVYGTLPFMVIAYALAISSLSI